MKKVIVVVLAAGLFAAWQTLPGPITAATASSSSLVIGGAPGIKEMLRAYSDGALEGPGFIDLAGQPSGTGDLGELATPFGNSVLSIQNLGTTTVQISVGGTTTAQIAPGTSRGITLTPSPMTVTYTGQGDGDGVRFAWVTRNLP